MLSTLDWIVLSVTLSGIVLYGVWKTRGKQDIEGYLLGNKQAKWWTVGLSVMATQASAITFLSTPGQAFDDGMRFVQFYFGLPIAMVILCVTFIPIYHKLKVYTAYEYLERRFDLKTRSLAAALFLIQRGMGAGITIYAPAIILSTILGWNLNLTIILIGILVIIYTVSGGTNAVSQTQKIQMAVIFVGMIIAFYLLVDYIPEGMSFADALHVAGASGKLNAIDFSIDIENRYTIWSGLTGGVFLMLAYFGTDQSQVQRYISGESIRQSRLGLIFNGLLKVPMQFLILLTGVMVFVFYQYHEAPVFFNHVQVEEIKASPYAADFEQLEETYSDWFEYKQTLNRQYLDAMESENTRAMDAISAQIREADQQERQIRDAAKSLIAENNPQAETNDRDYVFITFIINHLPIGLVGLLLAMIFSAAMSSTAAELNALGSTSTVDMYKRSIYPRGSDTHYVFASRSMTLLWGIIAILFALFGSLFENLIQFVNIIGSLFYGTILGIFLVAFYIKYLKGTPVFLAAVAAEIVVLLCFWLTDVGYLWFNLIGCIGVIIFAILIQAIQKALSPG